MTIETPRRTFRVEDELWNPAKEKAQQQGTSLSAVLRERLQEWTAGECGTVIDSESAIRDLTDRWGWMGPDAAAAIIDCIAHHITHISRAAS